MSKLLRTEIFESTDPLLATLMAFYACELCGAESCKALHYPLLKDQDKEQVIALLSSITVGTQPKTKNLIRCEAHKVEEQ